jgi:uroporphyrin-III C-methyltransferase
MGPGVIPAASLDAALRHLPRLQTGEVWLAGAGPGDPGLMTLHALAGLAQADVIVHDALVDPRVLDLARPDARRIFAGKRGGRPSARQADISAQLMHFAREGARVLRLKGGDPYVFGRGADEVLALATAKIPFRVIPGVTAGLAALTMALVPATVRGVNHAMLLATGHGAAGEDLDWAAVARLGQPVVLYMAMARIAAIARALLAGGQVLGSPAAVIASATLPAQHILVTTLGELAEAAMGGGEARTPAIVVIGEIVRMRAELLALMPQLAAEVPAWPSG